jgi:hypothetical protein
MPVRVVDNAAGHGRYVLDALAGSGITPDSILLRDYSDLNVTAGMDLIEQRGLAGITRFVKGDAFDRDSLATIEPPPTLAVVSGLYELFPDNTMVRRSLAGLAASVPPGGYLIYTNQPDLHQPALAPTDRTDRARVDKPSRRSSLDYAPPHASRNGPACRRCRLQQAGAAHRRMGHLHGVDCRAGRRLRLSGAAAISLTAAEPKGRPWRRAVAWLCLLGPFFFTSYGAANWLAEQRAHVGAIVFAWKYSIPLVPWTILPYWSIDAFYALSLFVCTSKAELDTHALRLLTAQIGAVTCFILFPLRFTFVRPEATGLDGLLFAALASFDKPFNQAPSLHIALLCIIWVLFARHVPRGCCGRCGCGLRCLPSRF